MTDAKNDRDLALALRVLADLAGAGHPLGAAVPRGNGAEQSKKGPIAGLRQRWWVYPRPTRAAEAAMRPVDRSGKFPPRRHHSAREYGTPQRGRRAGNGCSIRSTAPRASSPGAPIFGTADRAAAGWLAGAGHHRSAGGGRSAGWARIGQPTLFNGKPATAKPLKETGRRGARHHQPAPVQPTKKPTPSCRSPSRWPKRRSSTAATATITGLVASGHVDVVIEAGLKLYDYAALVPVVEGAGRDDGRLAGQSAGCRV